MLITIIGAGTMGNGIAHVFAQAGFDVFLMDSSPDQLDRAKATISKNLDRQITKEIISPDEKDEILARLNITTSMKEAVTGAGLVIEAATENEAVKLKIFSELDGLADPSAILA
ncbi:MAG: 3-hydroxyacyl-CoA dehydrogenase NAD-binding domain-containing protein, partial [Chitinophagaceae bacterium]